jgi:aminoglycoside phosphotransferase (APT) family kinase protein
VEPDDELRRILLRAFPKGRITACEALSGGISARAVVVDIVTPDGGAERVVFRRPSRGTIEETRRLVESEYRLLSRCEGLGIRAPRVRFLDPEVSCVVLDHVEGAPDFARAHLSEMLEQMAEELARIHSVPVTPELSFLRLRDHSFAWDFGRTPERLDTTLDEPRLRAELSRLWPWERHNPDVLLHGDFWPGNLLFRDGQLAAVIDWEESELGDPLADIAVTRLELLWAFGDDAAGELTERYAARRTIDWRNLHRWDLAVALRPMSNLHRWASSYPDPPINRPDITEATMRDGHRRFVQRAIEALGATGG